MSSRAPRRPPRQLPARSFPAYAFIPGLSGEHPTRSPRGHSHGRGPEPLASAFAWGVDLYNYGYLWEAHEAWEPLWQAAALGSPERDFVQGLIQCAAACLKVSAGQAEPARRLGARALEHLERALDSQANTRGLDLPAFRERFAAWIDRPEHVDSRPRLEISPCPVSNSPL